MTRNHLITALALLAFTAAPAFAATNYYVVKSASTKKCEVTANKPDGKTWMQIGTKVFTTKAAADTAMKAAADCK